MTLGDLLADPASEKVLRAQEGFAEFLDNPQAQMAMRMTLKALFEYSEQMAPGQWPKEQYDQLAAALEAL